MAEQKQPNRVNLRRPEIMQEVTQLVRKHYRSRLVDHIRARGNVFSAGDVTIKLARQFGFCYGVERAIDLAYAAAKLYSDRRIFILGEIIHNPSVNEQLRALGIRFLSATGAETGFDDIRAGDVVIIPAFGVEPHVRQDLEARGCTFVDTTCGDVMSVWKRVRQYAAEGITSIIHGKAWHEETKATCAQATANGNGHYLVIYDLPETDFVCNYILHGGDKTEFLAKFKGAHSPGFDPDIHLQAIGIANQTTMLRSETQEVQRRLYRAMLAKYGPEECKKRFRSFDTICGATQERQDALEELLREGIDLLIVIGGYNSSNTSHLAEMGEACVPTYFIKDASEILSANLIRHFNPRTKQMIQTENWLPTGPVTIGITAGASSPNNLVEDVIRRIVELRGLPLPNLSDE